MNCELRRDKLIKHHHRHRHRHRHLCRAHIVAPSDDIISIFYVWPHHDVFVVAVVVYNEILSPMEIVYLPFDMHKAIVVANKSPMSSTDFLSGEAKSEHQIRREREVREINKQKIEDGMGKTREIGTDDFCLLFANANPLSSFQLIFQRQRNAKWRRNSLFFLYSWTWTSPNDGVWWREDDNSNIK